MTDARARQAKWDWRFMKLAHEVASWSKDPAHKVGAVIVSPDRRLVAWGFNGLPPRVADTPERLYDQGVKRQLTVHAELNALLNSTDVRGWTLYCTRHPCAQCSAAIVAKGLAEVVVDPSDDPRGNWESYWGESQQLGGQILGEAGVRVRLLPP